MKTSARPESTGTTGEQTQTTTPIVSARPVEWDSNTSWRRFCGFLEFSTDAALDIQRRLLRDQIRMVADTPTGQRFMSAMRDDTIDEFRRKVPVTTYADYADLFQPGSQMRTAPNGYIWTYTATGPGRDKWVPYTSRGYERLLDNFMATLLLAAAERPGVVSIRPGDVVLYNVPPRPYLSGLAAFGMAERFGLKGVLDPATSESLDFKERIKTGFEEALRGKVDAIVSLTSVLNKAGARFEHYASHRSRDRAGRSRMPLNGRAAYRLARARIKSALTRRPIRPHDLWDTKAIIGWGLDTDFLKDRVQKYWGKPPSQMYASTEGGVMGMQPRADSGMVFSPYSDFYEFIPTDELDRANSEPGRLPDTLLLDEVEPGRTYELVITNFYGMPFVRYRLGHIVRIIAQRQNGPEFEFVARSDDRIDIAGFTRIDENTVWKALSAVGAASSDWTIRRENADDRLTIRLYIEPHGPCDEDTLPARLHESLKQVDPLYSDLEAMLGIQPLEVTLLPPGAFDRYYETMRRSDEPLTKRQPPRMNADDAVIDRLLDIADTTLEIAA